MCVLFLSENALHTIISINITIDFLLATHIVYMCKDLNIHKELKTKEKKLENLCLYKYP